MSSAGKCPGSSFLPEEFDLVRFCPGSSVESGTKLGRRFREAVVGLRHDASGSQSTAASLRASACPRSIRIPMRRPTVHLEAGSPPARYRCFMSSQRVPGGVVHKLPADLREALTANNTALGAWKDITPLARNEFICWVEDAKQETTRERRIRRTQEELEDGQRRPCCWPGCKHRDRTGR
jgi:hypothetical protein